MVERKKRCNFSIKRVNSKDFQKENLGDLKSLHNNRYEAGDRKKIKTECIVKETAKKGQKIERSRKWIMNKAIEWGGIKPTRLEKYNSHWGGK